MEQNVTDVELVRNGDGWLVVVSDGGLQAAIPATRQFSFWIKHELNHLKTNMD